MKLIKNLGMLYPTDKSKQKRRYGIYECPICGKHFKVRADNVKNGNTIKCKSCAMTIAKTKHGLCDHKLYNTWSQEKGRCNRKSSSGYKNYGGRGITVSEEFEDFTIWLQYVESLQDAYRKNYSIDRINNDKGYERGNLRWASRETQAQNTRLLSSNNTSGYRGISKQGKKWKAQIAVTNKQICLGSYSSPKDAAIAYDRYIIEHNLEHPTNI